MPYFRSILRFMDNSHKHIIQLLSDAEEKIQRVIVDSAKAGDYKTSQLTSEIANSLKDIQYNLNGRNKQEPALRMNRQADVGKNTKRVRKKVRRNIKNGYPKFEIKNDVLIRIGWSKKEKAEYTHKANKHVFDQTITAMENISISKSGPFMAEDIIDNLHENMSESTPTYQIYIVVGYLKSLNCIKQLGRDGYEFPPNIKYKAIDLWNINKV